MSLHEEQIKSKLLDADIQNYRKLIYEDKKVHKKNIYDMKKQSHADLSEWSTNQKTTTFTSFPTLKFGSQNIRKNKLIQPTLNQTFTNAYFTKFNFKPKDKTSLPNQINLSFNPQQSIRSRKKQKKISNSLPKQLLKSLQKAKKDSLQNYLINGKIKITATQNKQMQNTINRTDHLLRLLRQRQILRMKRYSFDIEGSFRTKSCLSP